MAHPLTVRDAIEEHLCVVGAMRPVLELAYYPAVSLLYEAIAGGHKILLCGNGGSAADAQHFAAELVVRYQTDRRPIAALALTADSAILTACGNDYGYEHVFARQVEALGQPGDVLVAISTSGTSKNVTEAVHVAKFRGLGTLGLSGLAGIAAGCDVDISVPSKITARIQEAHALVIHLLCEGIEGRMPK